MDVATMAAINNMTLLTAQMAIAQSNHFINVINSEGEIIEMTGSILDGYFGKECTVSLFNEVGAIKGILKDADAQWVKVETMKKGTQLINRNMIRNITFENK